MRFVLKRFVWEVIENAPGKEETDELLIRIAENTGMHHTVRLR